MFHNNRTYVSRLCSSYLLGCLHLYVSSSIRDVHFFPKLSCSKNCREKVVPDEKIILKSKCSAYCYGELSFSWSLYMYDDPNMPEPFNLTDLNAFSAEEFQNIASSPTNQIDIAIKPNSLEKDRKYIVAFRATRPSGVHGELRYTMLMNSPPSIGKRKLNIIAALSLSLPLLSF